MTHALGFEACTPCKRRQQVLNQWGENFRAAALGGKDACALCEDEIAASLGLMSEQHLVGHDALRILGRYAETWGAFFWFAETALRSKCYGCEETPYFVPASSTEASAG